MKKLLLSALLLGSAYTASSQVLSTDDFSLYTIGNIGTDITGATPGQYGWLTAGAANSDFQIVDNGGTHGNVLQITGSASAVGNKFMWTDTFSDIWGFRDAGNDILSVEFDFFTGPVTTSKNVHRVCAFNGDGSQILGGLIYTEDTRVLSGLSYYNNAGTLGNYVFNPTAANGGPFVLPANTWVRMGFSFNKTTGQVICKTSGLTTNLNMGINGAGLASDPSEIDIVCGASTGNTVSSIGLYDNYLVQASSTAILLAVDKVTEENVFALFPNPVTTVLNVTSKTNAPIKSITVADLNGRIVKSAAFASVDKAEVNIADLSAGVYVVSISSNEGTTTKRIVKN